MILASSISKMYFKNGTESLTITCNHCAFCSLSVRPGCYGVAVLFPTKPLVEKSIQSIRKVSFEIKSRVRARAKPSWEYSVLRAARLWWLCA